MNSKNLIIVIVVIIFIIFGIWALNASISTTSEQPTVNNQQQQATSTDQNVEATTTSTTQQPAAIKTYTLAQIAAHNSASSCWTAVDGKVYDVTKFIPDHPGGNEILRACGKDGSQLFHSEREHVEQNAQATLNFYYIGDLTK